MKKEMIPHGLKITSDKQKVLSCFGDISTCMIVGIDFDLRNILEIDPPFDYTDSISVINPPVQTVPFKAFIINEDIVIKNVFLSMLKPEDKIKFIALFKEDAIITNFENLVFLDLKSHSLATHKEVVDSILTSSCIDVHDAKLHLNINTITVSTIVAYFENLQVSESPRVLNIGASFMNTLTAVQKTIATDKNYILK